MALVPPPYHFGVVVADLESAQRELADALHLSWADSRSATTTPKW